MSDSLPLEKLKVSIVIRSKNESKTLPDLLDILFEQTEMGFELIIVDNGSNDGTLKMLKGFPVATVIHIPKNEFNHAYSCNLGMQVARTNFVVLTNGHCLPISRTWLADGLSNFSNKQVAAIDGNYRSRRDASYHERLGDIWQADTLNTKRKNEPITTTNAIIRKDLWEKYPFDESLTECEDYDWAREMIARGFETIKDPRFNVYHSHGLTKKQREGQNNKWAKLCPRIDKRKRPNKTKSKVFSKSHWNRTKTEIENIL